MQIYQGKNYDGRGMITNVCINRKIRNRLQDMGESILVIQNDRIYDGFPSIKDRVDNAEFMESLPQKDKNYVPLFIEAACKEWIDVRSFGQVFAYKGKSDSDNVSIGIRGPLSIQIAQSLETIDIIQLQITKAINNETNPKKDIYAKDNTTIGVKYIIDKAVYVTYGTIFPQLAGLTGFSDDDANKIKHAIATLFENDASSARPSGSMTSTLYWWEHCNKAGVLSSAKVHKSLNIEPIKEYPYFKCNPTELKDIKLEILGEFKN